MEPFYAARAVDQGFGRAVRNALGQFQNGNQAILRANQASLKDLGERAAANLNDRATRRAKDPRHGRLEDLVKNPGASTANIDGFQWLTDAGMAGVDARVAAYARAIEGGSRYWVNRTAGFSRRRQSFGGLHLEFVGEPGQPTGGASGQAGFVPGREDRRFLPVAITNPVPAYYWARDAISSFVHDGKYAELATLELNAVGLYPKRGRAPSK